MVHCKNKSGEKESHIVNWNNFYINRTIKDSESQYIKLREGINKKFYKTTQQLGHKWYLDQYEDFHDENYLKADNRFEN